MPVSMRDKIDLYENTLKRIAGIDAAAEEEEAMMAAPDKLYKHAFALGWVRGKLASTVQDAQWALNQGKK